MKKVLVAVVILAFGAGAYIAFSVYSASQSAGLVDKLAKFVIPEAGFEKYIEDAALKDDKEPAPLFELKVRGKDIIPLMATIIKDSGKPDNVRCASAIVLAHTKRREAIEHLIEGLKEKEGSLGECVSVMLQLMDSETVPAQIAAVLSENKEQKVRLNAYRAITWWVTDRGKRKQNEVSMEQVIKGLDEKDKPTLLLILHNMKRLQFNFIADKKNKVSLGEQLEEKLIPLLSHDDEEIAAAATNALEFQFSYMTDEQKVDAIKRIAPLCDMGKKRTIRLSGIRLIRKLNNELSQNVATISQCDLEPLIPVLDSDDAEILKLVIDTFDRCGTRSVHRQAIKEFIDRTTDEELKKLAEDAREKILKRESGGD